MMLAQVASGAMRRKPVATRLSYISGVMGAFSQSAGSIGHVVFVFFFLRQSCLARLVLL